MAHHRKGKHQETTSSSSEWFDRDTQLGGGIGPSSGTTSDSATAATTFHGDDDDVEHGPKTTNTTTSAATTPTSCHLHHHIHHHHHLIQQHHPNDEEFYKGHRYDPSHRPPHSKHSSTPPWLFVVLPILLTFVIIKYWDFTLLGTKQIQIELPKDGKLRGVYFMANDQVLDSTIAFLNSFRHFNPTLPLVMIPYSTKEECKELYKLKEQYKFQIYYNKKLMEDCDLLSTNFYMDGYTKRKNPNFRKMSMWDGPLHEFLYIDVDTCVLDSVNFVFPLLQTYGILTSSSHNPTMIPHTWKESIWNAGIMTSEQIQFAGNMGTIASTKEFTTSRQLLDKAYDKWPLIQQHQAKLVGDQAMLNYLFTTNGQKFSSFAKLQNDRLRQKVGQEYWGDRPFDNRKYYMTADQHTIHNNFRYYPYYLIHWGGDQKCYKHPDFVNTCEVYNYWRQQKYIPPSTSQELN